MATNNPFDPDKMRAFEDFMSSIPVARKPDPVSVDMYGVPTPSTSSLSPKQQYDIAEKQRIIRDEIKLFDSGKVPISGISEDAQREIMLRPDFVPKSPGGRVTGTPEQEMKSETAKLALNRLEQLYGRGDVLSIGTESDLSMGNDGSFGQRTLGKIKGALSGISDPKLREDINIFQDSLANSVSVFTQAFGSGTPQAFEMENMLKRAPGPGTTDREAKAWFNNMRNLLREEVKFDEGTSVAKEDKPLLKKIKDGLLQKSRAFAQDIGVGLAGEEIEAAVSSQERALEASAKLMRKAAETKDPEQRKRLLNLSQEIFTSTSNKAREMSDMFSEEIEDDALIRGFGVAMEIATAAETAHLATKLPNVPGSIASGAKSAAKGIKSAFNPQQAKASMSILNEGIELSSQGKLMRNKAISKAVKAGSKVDGTKLYNGISDWAIKAKRSTSKSSDLKAIDDILLNAKRFKGKRFRADTAKTIWDGAKEGFKASGEAKDTISAGYNRAVRDSIRGELERVAPGFEKATSLIKEGIEKEKILKGVRTQMQRKEIRDALKESPSLAKRLFSLLKGAGLATGTVGGAFALGDLFSDQ